MTDYRWVEREPSAAACRREITELHEFFVDWYTGQIDRERFQRVTGALAPGFERIDPDGDRQDRRTVLDSIRDTYDAYDVGGFEIDIRDAQLAASGPGFAVVRYEEWQTIGATNGQNRPTSTTGRISSATVRPTPDAPTGLAWVALQETWLEE